MKLDFVHDTQLAYRQLIHAMSRPGVVASFEEQAERIGMESDCFPATLLLALVLLDTEVTFHIVSEREEELARLFNHLTYARAAEAETADFIFVLSDASPGQLERAVNAAKIGSLIHPHESAVLIVEAESLSSGPEMILSGPGIEHTSVLRVETGGSWARLRAEKNHEYPMGLDMVFVDREHQAVCLPRTTRIGRQVEE